MSVKTFSIDGKVISAKEGQTILEAARDAGIFIPTLCHFPGLTNVGACRLCLVEVSNSSKLQPACTTKVSEGMEVRSNSEKLKEYRKLIIELLLSERNHQCSVCVANGNCELQNLAMTLGVDHVRFDFRFPNLPVDISHELFGIDHNRCILCTRCVRVCDEIEGAHTWDVANRGANAIVITDMNQPWGEAESCTSCGKCVLVCPTGALFKRGVSVAELQKDKSHLEFIIQARLKKQWIR
ncbi:MAG: bidirectional hydrogenase complex protein HoxU [Ignavibacteria bacterium]